MMLTAILTALALSSHVFAGGPAADAAADTAAQAANAIKPAHLLSSSSSVGPDAAAAKAIAADVSLVDPSPPPAADQVIKLVQEFRNNRNDEAARLVAWNAIAKLLDLPAPATYANYEAAAVKMEAKLQSYNEKWKLAAKSTTPVNFPIPEPKEEKAIAYGEALLQYLDGLYYNGIKYPIHEMNLLQYAVENARYYLKEATDFQNVNRLVANFEKNSNDEAARVAASKSIVKLYDLKPNTLFQIRESYIHEEGAYHSFRIGQEDRIFAAAAAKARFYLADGQRDVASNILQEAQLAYKAKADYLGRYERHLRARHQFDEADRINQLANVARSEADRISSN